MVDFQSKQRIHWFGYKATVFPEPSCSYHEQYHVQDRKTFPAHINLPVHDCRAEVVRNLRAPNEWEACLLLHGLRATYCDVVDSYDKKGSNAPSSDQKEDKLLYKLGAKGSKDGEFNYPCGLCTTVEGDIIVADSKNHRVQVLSQYGVFKFAFGQHGTDIGKFDEPTGVTELPDRNLAVADRKNRRVQVFSEKGKFCYAFSTMKEPYAIAADYCDFIAVASVTRLVEIYQARDCTLVSYFLVPVISGCRQNGNCPLHIGLLEQKIVVSDSADFRIKFFNIKGEFLYQFQPAAFKDGLCVAPGALWVSSLDCIMVIDTLNHGVSLYSSNGTVLQHVLQPIDGTGCFHSVSVSPEGHLITSEFSITGDHCIKIFRFQKCLCHGRLRPTSKRQNKQQTPSLPLD